MGKRPKELSIIVTEAFDVLQEMRSADYGAGRLDVKMSRCGFGSRRYRELDREYEAARLAGAVQHGKLIELLARIREHDR